MGSGGRNLSQIIQSAGDSLTTTASAAGQDIQNSVARLDPTNGGFVQNPNASATIATDKVIREANKNWTDAMNPLNASLQNFSERIGTAGGRGSTTTPTATPTATQTPTAAVATTTPQTSLAATYGTGQSMGANTIHQTLLTGPGGVDPNQLTLGRTTLLGTSTGANNG